MKDVEEITVKINEIAKTYDLTKVSVKVVCKDGIIVICIIPYGHYYITIKGNPKITLMKKRITNPSLEYMELIASTINSILF